MPLVQLKSSNLQCLNPLHEDVSFTKSMAPHYCDTILLWSTRTEFPRRIVRWFKFINDPKNEPILDSLKQEIELKIDPDLNLMTFNTGLEINYFIYEENISSTILSHQYVPIPSLFVHKHKHAIKRIDYEVGFVKLKYKNIDYKCFYIKSNNINEWVKSV